MDWPRRTHPLLLSLLRLNGTLAAPDQHGVIDTESRVTRRPRFLQLRPRPSTVTLC